MRADNARRAEESGSNCSGIIDGGEVHYFRAEQRAERRGRAMSTDSFETCLEGSGIADKQALLGRCLWCGYR